LKYFLAFALTLFSFQSFASINCKAYTRFVDEYGSPQTLRTTLKVTFESPEQIRLEADIDQVNFSLLAEKSTNENLMMITEGPLYKDGAIVRGSFDANGIMNLGKVSPNIVHKIECRKVAT